MARKGTTSGWIAFAGWLMLVIGALDFFEGLIAVIRGQYYALTPTQIIVVDMRAWGWTMMIWGIVLALAGLGLFSGAGWSRWFTIVVVSLNFLVQLGFVGGAAYPLWALIVLFLQAMVLYALFVHWDDSEPAMA
jgi:phosphoglycerol transferase MdoB-like AlkP superfamily enzyme